MQLRHPLLRGCLRCLILILALCCVSCGTTLYPVHGKVLHRNQPLEGALVTFHATGATLTTVLPTGLSEEDGSFTLTTGDKEGAPAGEYKVTVICPERVKSKAKKMSMGEKPES